jgi:excisionase family DNA binding protein
MKHTNPKSLPADRWISLEDAAAWLGCSVVTLRRRIRHGDLKAKRLGHQIIRVRLRDVEALLRDVPSAVFDD